MMAPRRNPERAAQEGILLIELVLALSIMSVGTFGFLYAIQSNFRLLGDLGTQEVATNRIKNVLEILEGSDFAALYDDYNGASMDPVGESGGGTSNVSDVGRLLDLEGNDAMVTVTFHVDETDLPAEYGPIQDLDGDDELATYDVSDSYQLLPTHLSITYQLATGSVTKELYIILAE